MNEDFSSKARAFIRKDTVLFATILFMVLLNWLSNIITQGLFGFTFPWALIVIGGILIAVVDDIAKIFFAEGASKAGSRNTARENKPAKTPSMMEMQMAQVHRYQQDMSQLAKTAKSERIKALAVQFDDWVVAIERMAGRIDAFRQNATIQHDLEAVPKSISKIQAQLAGEQNDRMRAQLQHTLSLRQNQLESLQKLERTIEAAEIQMESSVAVLGTIYSQALASQSTNQIVDFSHLTTEAQEQTHALNDYLETLEEVRLGRAESALS
jgi:hypothetical protein